MAEALPVRIVEVPLGDPRIKDFVQFHWDHYKGNEHWVPQLDADLLGSKILGTKGLLTPESGYHKTADVMHFIAYRGDKAVGRVSAAINHRYNEYNNTNIANFGFFETINDYAVAEALLDAARGWAKARGAEVLRGPGEYGNATHERQGCLIEGFDEDVYVEHTWNYPYYQELIERYGFTKSMDYVAHMIDLTQPVTDRLASVATGVRARANLETRAVDMKNFDADLRMVIDIYNQAWAQNWGFLPISDWEVDALVESLKPIIDPGLVRFAFHDGKPIAVLGAFPDPNYLLRPKWNGFGNSDLVRVARLMTHKGSIPRVRLFFFGIVPGYRRMGADALLYQEVHQYTQLKGYKACDVSLLLEVNELIIRAAEFMGGHEYKKWRIFDLPL